MVESPVQPINKPAIPYYSLYPQYFLNPFPQPLLYPPPLPTHAAPVLHAQVKEKEENTEKRVKEKVTVEQVSEANNADLAELCLIDSGCDATHVHQEKFFSETCPSLLNKSVITDRRCDLMHCERFLLKYWHGRISHLSGLQQTITLGAVHSLPP